MMPFEMMQKIAIAQHGDPWKSRSRLAPNYFFGFSATIDRTSEKSLTSLGVKFPFMLPASLASSMEAKIALSLAVPS